MAETVEITFTAVEMVKLMAIVNHWPCHNGGEVRMIQRLGPIVDLTDADKQAIEWREFERGGRVMYQCNSLATVTRAVGEQERRVLLAMVQSPPEEAAWVRGDFGLLNSLLAKLGGEAIEEVE